VGFTVTSIAPGKTSVSVADNHSQTQSVNVLVNGGSLSLSSSVLNFTVSDNTSGFLSLPPIGVTGTLETTAGGSGHIYVQAPGNITGANGGVLLISYLHYDCSGAVDANTNQGGVFNNTAQPYIQLNAGGNSNDCLTVTDHTGQGQFSNLSFNLNLFLNDYTVPADTYRSGANGNGSFFLTLSAT
jgi:hypothetical protein